MRSSLLWLLVTIILLGLQVRLGWPAVSDRLANPFWWPLLAGCLFSFGLIIRRLRTGLMPDRASLLLISLSILVTIAAFLRPSVWLYLPAFWLSTWALTASAGCRVPAARNSVLTLPVLLFAGFPPYISAKLVNGFSDFTSQQFLLYSGLQGKLVWGDPGSLFTADGGCRTESILLSPFGLPLLLVGSCLLSIRCRRSFVQTALLTGFAAVNFLFLQAITVWLIMLFPGQLSTADGTPGWGSSLLLAGCAFACIVISQFTVLALTTPVTSSQMTAPEAPDPWIILWDYFIGGQPIPAAVTGSARLGTVLAEARRELRSAAIIDTLWTWWYTRNWMRAGLAILLTAVSGSVPFFRFGSESRQRAISLIEAITASAELAGQQDQQEQALRMLVSLQPTFGRPRLQLTELLWETGRIDECRETLRPLISPGPQAWAPARIWLVQNSLKPAPLIPLDDAARIEQLQAVLQESPGNGVAASLLSQLYMADGETSLAENTLADAADADPANATLLLKFCMDNNRPIPSPAVYQRLLQTSRNAYLATPTSQRTPAQVTLLAEMLLALGQIGEAFNVAADARQRQDAPELQRLEATIRLRRISQTATSEFVNPRAILDDLESAVTLQPDSETALELAALLTITEGARLSQTALDDLAGNSKPQPPDQASAGRKAVISLLRGDWTAAVSGLRQVQPKTSAQQLALVFALRQAQRTDEAEDEAAQALRTLSSAPSLATLSQALLLQIAAGKLQLPEDITLVPDSPESRMCAALLDQFRFDRLTGYPGDLSPDISSWQMPPELAPAAALQLLETPLRYRNTQAAAARRLYRLRRSSGKRRPAIDSWLQQMRATLGESDQILLVVGTLAVLDEAWDEAIYWLDAAKRSTATPTPAILNNLAIAIVRARRMERCREALTLVDTAMTLLPDNADLFASRAEIYLALKDQSAALKDLQQAVKLQPDNAEALRLLRVLDAAEQR